MEKKYTILGIHGADVSTVEGNVARVRMIVNDKEVDEDFDLPPMPPSVQKTIEVYDFFMRDTIEARIKELEGKE